MARERPQIGLMGLASGAGNTGFTMGGFVIYLLLGQQALGLVSIYCLMWTPLMVLLLYPIARRYSPSERPAPLGRLILRSLFDWRSIGLPIAITGLLLRVGGVPLPQAIARWRVIDVLMYSVAATAYFSIGLRLHASHVLSAWRHIAALAGLRFGAGMLVGLGLLAVTLATPWPLDLLARKVFLIECCVPTAITMVAVCNMFGVRPREASVLFIANTMMYLVIVLPVVVLLAG
jgi:predicted permease